MVTLNSEDRRLKWGSILLGGVLAHVSTVAIIAAVAAIYGFLIAPEPGLGSVQGFAPRAGLVIGPTIGTLLTYLFGAWAARRSPGRERLAGTLVGVVAALAVLPVLLGADADARPWYALSMGLKVVAGAVAGVVAARRSASS